MSSAAKAAFEIIEDLEFEMAEGNPFSEDDLHKLNDLMEISIQDSKLLTDDEKGRVEILANYAER